MKIVRVVAAVIRKEDSIFATQRGYGAVKDGWEFPGGKREAGETMQACAERECLEELGLTIRVTEQFGRVAHRYPDREVSICFFLAECTGGALHTYVHEQVRWVRPEELMGYDFCPADEEILRRLSKHDG